ncbi:MAG: hypothetical protein AAGE80_17075 [Pseudomonadota bacterium]
MVRTLIAVLAVASLTGCAERLDSGVKRKSILFQEGHLKTQKVDCGTSTDCSAMIRALEGGTRAIAVVSMPNNCYHTVTTLNPVLAETVSPPAEDFTPVRYRRVEYKRPARIELERYELEQLAAGATLDLAFRGCSSGAENRVERISFPADQVRELNSLLVDRPIRIH